MLITDVFLYHKKIGKYGINSEKLRNSIMNSIQESNKQIYGSARARISRGGRARGSERT
ncbi:hypothetical protein L211DRAFT_441580 [Terfezia boudieri ATCC MYA-4762]|uniref:Uncharacterized protein n=1 Tax=Terfezia boudieri ATCC MYA-4762 TaxID=1051890 RepID=A0A3N4LKY6_9PEZI|nr:hypothetical protein L211DRAFT_441580 [Terfezia boudieri ATCC MYA-4762]